MIQSLRGLVPACVVAVAMILMSGLGSAERRPDSFADLVERLKPTVVNIQVTIVERRAGSPNRQSPFGRRPNDQFEDFFKRFFGDRTPREYRNRAIGSGFIISPDGYIVSNNHVVEKASEIKVKLENGKEYKARLIGRDPKTDLALIKIESKQLLPFTEFGDSSALRVGDWVMAIGNPFGLSHTVTAGIVSAKGRSIGAGPYDDFIQTDASINQGNSGGPLFNTDGKVVGINTAIIAGGTGIGFAIPANMAKKLIGQLRETGTVVRGFLGVHIQNLTPELAKRFGMKKTKGALVSDVTKGSPANRAGVQKGDVIVSFDGAKIQNVTELVRKVGKTAVGKRVSMKVLREGKKIILKVKIGKQSEKPRSPEATGDTAVTLGLRLRPVPDERAKELGIEGGQGVLVIDVVVSSPAARGGIRAGDIILEVNRKAIRSVAELNEAVSKGSVTKGSDDLLFFIQRGVSKLYTVVPKK